MPLNLEVPVVGRSTRTIVLLTASVAALSAVPPAGPAEAQDSARSADTPAAGADTVVRRQRGHPDVLGAYLPPDHDAVGREDVWPHDRYPWTWRRGLAPPPPWLGTDLPEVPGLFPRPECRRDPRGEADYLIPLLAPPPRCRLPPFRRHRLRPGPPSPSDPDTIRARPGSNPVGPAPPDARTSGGG